MSFAAKFKKFFDDDDDFYEEEEQRSYNNNETYYNDNFREETRTPEINEVRESRNNNYDDNQYKNKKIKEKAIEHKISLFDPKVYTDAQSIANQLLSKEAVIINFSSIDDSQSKRIIDFLSGSVYSLDGSIEVIGEKIVLVTPSNYQVTGSLSEKFKEFSDF